MWTPPRAGIGDRSPDGRPGNRWSVVFAHDTQTAIRRSALPAYAGTPRRRAGREADARLSAVSTLGTPSPSLSRRPPGADSTMPTRRPASWAVVLITVAVLAACDAGPVVTGPPAVGNPTPDPVLRVAGAQRGRRSAARAGRRAGPRAARRATRATSGRIEATEARTVVFTLCAPDGAFLSRVAHPALGILDAATIAELATNPDSARSLAGTGPYRIDHWTPGQNVRLVRAGDASSADGQGPDARPHLGRRPDPAHHRPAVGDRRRDRRPGAGRPRPNRDAARARRLPARRPRDRLPGVRDRRRPGQGRRPARPRRRASIATRWRPTGSPPARPPRPTSRRARSTAAAAARDWYGFNAPAASAALAAAKFDLGADVHAPHPRPAGARPARSGRARQGRRRAARDQRRAAHRDRHDALRRLPGRSRDRQARRAVPRRGRLDPRGSGRVPRPPVRHGRRVDHRRPDPEGRAARSRRRQRPPTPPRAPTRSAAPTTPSGTPRPSSRWPTRARSPRSGPT